jgi:hypothetical protein
MQLYVDAESPDCSAVASLWPCGRACLAVVTDGRLLATGNSCPCGRGAATEQPK